MRRTALPGDSPKSKRWLFFLAAAALALAASLACSTVTPGITAVSGSQPPPTQLPAAASGEMSLEEALAIAPEDARPEVLRLMGQPDTFHLVIQDLGGTTVRLEEWSYYDYGSRFDFVDGELVWTVDIEPLPDGSIFAQYYDPLAFGAYASSADVRGRLGGVNLMEDSLKDLDVPAGALLAGPQILLGFDADRLVFVETYALSPEKPP